MGKIIFLNGCGSSGKTTIAKSLQDIAGEPWLRLGVDTFIDMMPQRYIALGDKAEEGYFHFRKVTNSHGPSLYVQVGEKGDQVFGLMPAVANLLAARDNNLIIDEVLLNDNVIKQYVKGLTDHTVYFVGIFCDLPTLTERKKTRGDRALGLANDQIDRVHRGLRDYDLTIDTTSLTPHKAVAIILEYLDENPHPQGFVKMGQELESS